MSHDYPKLIADTTADLPKVKGQVLKRVLLNIVGHEFNVLYLQFTSGWFRALGINGSETLGFYKFEGEPVEGPTDETGIGQICTFPPFEIFTGKEVAEVRQTGEAWNGHGFEFTFTNLFDKTLIVQSIYTGNEPKDYIDCIKLGIGTYFYNGTEFALAREIEV